MIDVKGIRKYKFITYTIMVIVFLVFTGYLSALFWDISLSTRFVTISIFLISIIVFEIILYDILKIIKSVEKNDSFSWNNVGRVNKMNYFIWILVIFRMILNFIHDFSVFDLSVGLLIILAIFIKILSKVFIEAYKLKHIENTLREETELTI